MQWHGCFWNALLVRSRISQPSLYKAVMVIKKNRKRFPLQIK